MNLSDLKSRWHPVMKMGLKWVHGSGTFERRAASPVNEVGFDCMLAGQISQWFMNQVGLAPVFYCTSCGAVVDWVFEDDVLFICPKCSRIWHKDRDYEERLNEHRRLQNGSVAVSKESRTRQRDLVPLPEGCGVQEEFVPRGGDGPSSEGQPPHGEGTD